MKGERGRERSWNLDSQENTIRDTPISSLFLPFLGTCSYNYPKLKQKQRSLSEDSQHVAIEGRLEKMSAEFCKTEK